MPGSSVTAMIPAFSFALVLLHRGAQIEGRLAEAWRAHGAYRAACELLAAAVVEDQFAATTRPRRGVTVMTIPEANGKEFDEVIVFEGPYQRYLSANGGDRERSARFNLLVAATRAKRSVVLMTPAQDPCPLLPQCDDGPQRSTSHPPETTGSVVLEPLRRCRRSPRGENLAWSRRVAHIRPGNALSGAQSV